MFAMKRIKLIKNSSLKLLPLFGTGQPLDQFLVSPITPDLIQPLDQFLNSPVTPDLIRGPFSLNNFKKHGLYHLNEKI